VADLILDSRAGEDEFREIEQAIASRPDRYHQSLEQQQDQEEEEEEEEALTSTPPARENPEPPDLNAPLGPANALRMAIPAAVSGHDAVTPTPTPGGNVPLVAMSICGVGR